MGVLLQAFYWDCPREAGVERGWWRHVAQRLDGCRGRASPRCGFRRAARPPARRRWATTRSTSLISASSISAAASRPGSAARPIWSASSKGRTRAGMQVYADAVYNHMSGGELETNPDFRREGWTRFPPGQRPLRLRLRLLPPEPLSTLRRRVVGRHARPLPPQPGRLRRDHGAREHADHRDRLRRFPLRFRQGLRRVDGACDPGIARSARGNGVQAVSVGECWDNSRTIGDWLNETNAWSDNRKHSVSAAGGGLFRRLGEAVRGRQHAHRR